MEIKKYKKFLEEKENDFNYREDEHSHLNDDLNSRWDDSTYDPWEDDPGFRQLHSDEPKGTFRDEELEDDVDGNDMDHLVYLLRTMYKNSGIDVQIDYKGLDIMIYCVMSYKERLKDIISVFEVSNKLKKDILPQYDSEFEMWETRKGQPLLIFNFYYKEGLRDDNMPF
jgi:hypothetical protein